MLPCVRRRISEELKPRPHATQAPHATQVEKPAGQAELSETANAKLPREQLSSMHTDMPTSKAASADHEKKPRRIQPVQVLLRFTNASESILMLPQHSGDSIAVMKAFITNLLACLIAWAFSGRMHLG